METILKPLTEEFVPNNFPYRDEQMKTIQKVFDDWKQFSLGDNLIISGATGAGKTAVITKIISEKDNTLFASCKENNSTRKVMISLTGKKMQMATDLLTDLIKSLKQNPKIIILDEVHRVRDVELLMDCLNEIHRQVGVPVIIITNQFGFTKKIPQDAKFTLFFQRVDFKSYNSLELKDILTERVNLLSENLPDIPEGTIEYICAKVVKEHFGSARVALDLARKCYKNNNFCHTFVNRVINQINEEEVFDFISKLSRTEKLFLDNLLELSKQKEEMTSSDIKKIMPEITLSRVSQLITTFVKDYAILEEDYKNYGRNAGRFRIIKFMCEKDKASYFEALHPEMMGDKIE